MAQTKYSPKNWERNRCQTAAHGHGSDMQVRGGGAVAASSAFSRSRSTGAIGQ